MKEGEASTGEKTATEQEKRDARLALQQELYKNLNEITGIIPRQPDKVERYMRQSLLGFPVDSAPDGDGGPDPDPDPEESSSSSCESSSSSEPEPPMPSSSFFFSSSSSGP